MGLFDTIVKGITTVGRGILGIAPKVAPVIPKVAPQIKKYVPAAVAGATFAGAGVGIESMFGDADPEMAGTQIPGFGGGNGARL